MIAYLDGKIILKKEKFIILDVSGIGYKIFLSKKSLAKIPEISKPLKLFCFLNIKEDAMDLYGFLNYKELEFFEILDNIRGVGPKAALEISSLGSLEDIKEKILSKQNIFEGIPGIGSKKAMAIILELTGKIKRIFPADRDEAEESLVGLGFSRSDAKQSLDKIPKNIENSEERIKQALKILGK